MSSFVVFNFVKRIALLLFFSVLMSGCLMVKGQVSSFSSLTTNSVGETFFMLPNDQQASSAEFDQYASSIARRLEKKGWYRVMSPDEAKYAVLLDYGIAGSTEKLGSSPIYGHTGGGVTTHSGTVNTFGSGYGGFTNSYGSYQGTSHTLPTYGVVGVQSYSYTQYQRYFQMKVVEMEANKAVYETKASSQGTNANFGIVAECIFDMALSDFPLQSSSSKSILMDSCGSE